MSALNKTTNGYVDVFSSEMYAAIPKAVWAAIAISALTTGGEEIDAAEARVVEEWSVLHENGIVPQAPPKKFVSPT